MKTFYKVFLILFIIFISISFYAIDWRAGFIFSISSGILGIIVVYILHTWSKLADKK